jgi:curved DNA-binding protein CbpA
LSEADDPYRVLHVHRDACAEVITAAFTVLREMTLRDDSDDAHGRLVALNRAHLVLGDPARRAAYDRQKDTE